MTGITMGPYTMLDRWSQWPDSNRRPAVYETAALPTELHWHIAITILVEEQWFVKQLTGFIGFLEISVEDAITVNDRPATDNERHLAPLHTHVSCRCWKDGPLVHIVWRATGHPRCLRNTVMDK
jgi:hypothetical protein